MSSYSFQLESLSKRTQDACATLHIDACVMECYFRDHMAERDLLFHDTVAPYLVDYDAAATEAHQRDILTQLHATLNAPDHAFVAASTEYVPTAPTCSH